MVFHFFRWVFPRYFPGCSFEVCQSTLMPPVTFVALQLCIAGNNVHFVCVFVCMSVWPVMICLCVLELLVQFYDPFTLCCLFFLDASL